MLSLEATYLPPSKKHNSYSLRLTSFQIVQYKKGEKKELNGEETKQTAPHPGDQG
jgi:hypothetical protein